MTEQSKLIYSLPGEWIDRAGRSRPKTPIRRILAIKPDHIGDLLIAVPAFALLRQFFPAARIELVCGTWNVALARRLQLFDAVHGVNSFHELSERQSDPDVARRSKLHGVATLEGLHLGYYDLAIDMRYDRDSRSILPSIEAGIFAGFGSAGEFPFLDIIVPIHDAGCVPPEKHEATFAGRSFHNIGVVDPRSDPGAGCLMRSPSVIELYFTIKGAKSPEECGTIPGDKRPLGVAIQGIAIDAEVPTRCGEMYQPLNISKEDLLFLSGWGDPEGWGTWTLGTSAHLAIRIPEIVAAEARRLRVVLTLRAHVNYANPTVECFLWTSPEIGGQAIFFKYPTATSTVLLSANPIGGQLTSEPFVLAPGMYEGFARMYFPMSITERMAVSLALKSSSATIFRRSYGEGVLKSGVCDLPVSFIADLANEKFIAVITVSDAAAFEGATVELFSVACRSARKPRIPIAHMEQWASLLVMRVAQALSTEPPFDTNAVLGQLTTKTVSGFLATSAATHALIKRIHAWQAEGSCVVAIALGCNSEIRKWSRQYFIELARQLLDLGELEIIFIGSSADREDASVACKALDLEVERYSFCGSVALDELGAVLEVCDLFLGNNTGTTHYAGRVGVRTIGIYSGTNHPREWGPVGPNASWISRDEPCAPCSLTDLDECTHGHVCLRNLLPSEVFAIIQPEVLALIDRRKRERHLKNGRLPPDSAVRHDSGVCGEQSGLL